MILCQVAHRCRAGQGWRFSSRGCLVRFATTSARFCPFEALNVPKNASQAQIKKAYYKMVFDLHPDRQVAATLDPKSGRQHDKSMDHSQKERFLRVVKAYEILTNKDKRREWELSRDDFTPGGTGTYSSSTRFDGAQRASSPFGAYSDFNPFGAYDWQSPKGWRPPEDEYFSQYHWNPSMQATEPRYMSNAKMGLLIVTFALTASAIVYMHITSTTKWLQMHRDRKHTMLQNFYDDRTQRARENGIQAQLEPLRRKQEAMERLEKVPAAALDPSQESAPLNSIP
ncbi:hypothetical protein BC832DRAFT_213598 [Gaertneriomyces semiglobifer]|nr:hypothetical protein BC832DRAFT_213598 [Gaertneriomyces semiglobifer]